MWKRLARTLALVAFVLATTLAAVPVETVAQEACKAADGHRKEGSLARAKKLYESVKARDGDQRCAAVGLRLVADARQGAAELVTAGQLLIRSGELDGAEKKFRSALDLDAASVAAAAGIARISDLESRPLPTAVSNGDRFYSDWALPIGRLAVLAAIGLLILYALAGLLSRMLVRVDAVAWSVWLRRSAGGLGFFLLFTAAVMAPLFAMFNPFTPVWTQCWIGVLTLAVVGLVAVALVLQGAAAKGDVKSWFALLLSLGVVTVAGALVVLLASGLSYDVRLMFVHIALAVIGVLLTAASFGQNLRLQVEVQEADGSVNAASSDYLLARMKGLGTETPRALHKATSALASTPLSQIPSEELSVLPAGKVVGALSQLFFALRPDLTWRARVTLVDDNRVATALSRNGRHAASAVFSRAELGLSEDVDKDRAKAQMLTGAAAFILVHLSEVHRELQDDLYGADQWKSVALQVIARSKSLLAEGPGRTATQVELLAKAVNEDAGNELARFEYLWAAYEYRPYAETDFGAFAKAIDDEYRSSKLSGMSDHEEGWMPLKIRVLYSSATQWLNAYVTATDMDTGRPRWMPLKIRVQYSRATQWLSARVGSAADAGPAAMLKGARESATELGRLCEKKSWKRRALRRQTETMRPLAQNLLHCIDALEGDAEVRKSAGGHPHRDEPTSLRLAYDYACLHMFIARQPGLDDEIRREQRTNALEDLQRALVTEAERTDAQGDPCFAELRSDERFQELVRAGQDRSPRL
jgi:tetratricopeptide (TPR) repeat protein